MRVNVALGISVIGLAVGLLGCPTSTPELEPPKKEPTPVGLTSVTATAQAAPPASSAPPKKAPPAADDPLKGEFSLADATKDLKGKGAIFANIATSEGELKCKLLDDKAPITVANFIGLATGKRTWKDPKSGQWVNKPAYDGTTFHRIIKGFMIQGGDPNGNGSGEPGYVIPDEKWPGGKHDKAGLLCMANRGPNTNGAQFFITDDAAPHLDVSYTIFGECTPVDTIHKIASVKVAGERPEKPVNITSVKITRADK